jgi:hypothetical protein
MPRKQSAVPVVALVVLGLISAVHGQEQAQILIPMLDNDGNSVETFGPGDLTVFENGKETKIVKIEPRDQPVRVTLALDNGRELGPNLAQLRQAAKEFFKALPESAEASLMTLAPQPRVAVRMTKDRNALITGVDRVVPDSGPGRFIEAVQDVARDWSREKGTVTPVLVIVGSSFASENLNKRYVEDARGQISKARGIVHVIMMKPASATAGEAQEMVGEQVARESRGRYELIGSHLQYSILTEMAGEIRKAAGRQFLVTLQRPEGSSGPLGPLSMSPRDGLKPGRITRVP